MKPVITTIKKSLAPRFFCALACVFAFGLPKPAGAAAWIVEKIHENPLFGINQGQFSFAQRTVFVYVGGRSPDTSYWYAKNIIAVAYHDPAQTALSYARRINGVWESEIVDAIGETGRHPALVLDGSGRARITYYNGSTNRIRYARQLGDGEESYSCGGWVPRPWSCTDVPDTYGSYITYKATGLSALRLGSDGTIHVAYAASYSSGHDVAYTTRGDTAAQWNPLSPVRTWVHAPGYSGELSFRPVFLALELASGKPEIGIRQAGSPLYWLHDKGYSSWQHDVVAPKSNTSANEKHEHHGMVLGSDGLPRFVYTEDGNLKLSTRLSGGGWSHSTVHQSVGAVPCSIDLNSSDYPRISYFQGVPEYKLQLASWYYNPNPYPYSISTSGWAESTVDSGPDMAVRNQIQVTSDDKRLLVYYDAYSGFFKFAEWK
jgi:hypothetical protein